MFHTLYEALPGQTRGQEIARSESWVHITSIAQTMSKTYTEFTYTCENANIDKIIRYRAGEITEARRDGQDITAQYTQDSPASVTRLLGASDFAPCASAGAHIPSMRHTKVECRNVNPDIFAPEHDTPEASQSTTSFECVLAYD